MSGCIRAPRYFNNPYPVIYATSPHTHKVSLRAGSSVMAAGGVPGPVKALKLGGGSSWMAKGGKKWAALEAAGSSSCVRQWLDA